MLRLVFVTFAFAILAGCASNVSHTPVPKELIDEVELPGFVAVRTWADEVSPEFAASIKTRFDQLARSGLDKQPIAALSLSGGGADGAFGAGVLNGWTARGTRPSFEIVSGVSTGALIAPLAFLGPKYDYALRDFYTGISTDDIARSNLPTGLFIGSALADSSGLRGIIERIVDAELLAKLAREHKRGRRLLVVTTNLEAERPVLWDMGKIATYATPEARELFVSVLLASASVPAAFPPVPITVLAGGQKFNELHVDGGTTTNVFVAPLSATLSKKLSVRKRTLYVIRNGKLAPVYKPINPKTVQIAMRSISTLTKYQNNSDVRRLQLLTQKVGSGFQLIAIPPEFEVESKEAFDPVYMKALYELGYKAGLSGKLWLSNPKIF